MHFIDSFDLCSVVVNGVPHNDFNVIRLIQNSDQVPVPQEMMEFAFAARIIQFQVTLPIILTMCLPDEQVGYACDYIVCQELVPLLGLCHGSLVGCSKMTLVLGFALLLFGSHQLVQVELSLVEESLD